MFMDYALALLDRKPAEPYGFHLTTQCAVLVLLRCRSGRLPAVYRRTGTGVAPVSFRSGHSVDGAVIAESG